MPEAKDGRGLPEKELGVIDMPRKECEICGEPVDTVYKCKVCGANFCEECGSVEDKLCLMCLEEEEDEDWEEEEDWEEDEEDEDWG